VAFSGKDSVGGVLALDLQHMIFNTFSYYLLFLLPTAILFRMVAPAVRPWIIVVGGALFFIDFSYELSGLRGALCLLIFLAEALMSRLYRPGSRWCLWGLVQSVALLAIFKYLNFFTSLVYFRQADPLWWNGAFLPLGISFFTFEFYHYAWDRMHGKTEAGTTGEYLAFILFFPTMVAGPIKRYEQFLPALRAPSPDWVLDFERGITRILTGLAKKFAVADLLTAATDNLNHAAIATADRRVLPLWLLAYGIRIYMDFSGYSDIAIGSARLFGIRVPENFDWPYLQSNISEFWARWHMSLTRWLIDYVYIPLGGSRVSLPRIYANVLTTMLVSGLWHGARLHFLVWGLCHGVLLCVHRAWRFFRGHRSPHPTLRAGSTVFTFVAVNALWAFFAMDVSTALFFFRRMLIG
jgi:alginate O-acetyltransferase complex protein AlgI